MCNWVSRRIPVLTLVAVFPAFLSCPSRVAAQQAEPASQAAASQARPKIAVALGGGAARGLAHIGIFQWFEEHRIPVDLIAGTSAGGLVGGAYATGMSPAEMRVLMSGVDWDLVFLADSPFKYKTFRRKEDARAYPGQIDFGLKGGFKFPSGLNSGQQVQLLLDYIALAYYELERFDDLPIPYRAVATELRKSERVVFDAGSLSRAMRATMAIPGVFTPVVEGDRVYVDGGILDNVPADVARDGGADVVIAVSVGASTDGLPPPASLFDVLSQTIDTFMTAGVNTSLKQADIVIIPNLKGYFGLDWRRSDEIADRGYQACEAIKDQLLRYQVDEATWEAWKRERAARRRAESPVVAFVDVAGVPDAHAGPIRERIGAELRGRPFDRAAVETAILRLSGTDRYELIRYRLARTAEGVGLVLDVTPKSYGPPFLLPAFDLTNVDSNSFAADLRLRLATYDTLVTNSEVRVDLGVGTNQTVAGELYRRLGRSKVFVAPRAYFSRRTVNAFNDDNDQVAEYSIKRLGGGVDGGYVFGPRAELRVGYDLADVRARRRIGEPVLPEARGDERVVSVRYAFDGQNSPLVPSRGVYLRSGYRYYLASPDLVDANGNTIEATRKFSQGEVVVNYFTRLGGRTRLFVVGAGGTSFGDDPGINTFRLGGPFRLGAFNNDEIVGDNYMLGTVGVLREWFRLPDVLGGNAYYGAWLENGAAFNEWSEADYRGAFSGGVIIETILGPVFLGGSVSLTSGASET